MSGTPKAVSEYMSKLGKKGGEASRRDLSSEEAKRIVAIREKKRRAKLAIKKAMENQIE